MCIDNLKETLKSVLRKGGRAGRYQLIIEVYGNILKDYPNSVAAELISLDLGVQVPTLTIRRAMNNYWNQGFERNERNNHEKKTEVPHDIFFDTFKPADVKAPNSSNITFHK